MRASRCHTILISYEVDLWAAVYGPEAARLFQQATHQIQTNFRVAHYWIGAITGAGCGRTPVRTWVPIAWSPHRDVEPTAGDKA